MPQNASFFFHELSRDLLVSQKNDEKSLFSTFHPLSPVIFATAAVVAFVLLRNSRFNFHCYTQREATPTQKSARKWRCDLSRLLARKITKGIHSCKPFSLNRLIATCTLCSTLNIDGWCFRPGRSVVNFVVCLDVMSNAPNKTDKKQHTPYPSAKILFPKTKTKQTKKGGGGGVEVWRWGGGSREQSNQKYLSPSWL